MSRTCHSRLLKNARFLQSPDVSFFPRAEPPDGFPSLVPAGVLRRLERISPAELGAGLLSSALARRRPPTPRAKAAAPLFSGTLRFVQATFISSAKEFSVPAQDLAVALQYAGVAARPISEYCSQYGPNSLAVASATTPFRATVSNAKYNDSALSGWVDQIAKSDGLGPDSCLVFLNPQGVVNADADATQGVLGYHSLSSSGVPYAFVNVMGRGLILADGQDFYALALSHEIAEMAVDPQANGSNPEVCDECAGNCNVDFRNYFAQDGSWLGGSASPGYSFFTDGVATPASVAQCPAPVSACTYPPPKQARS